MLAKFSFFVLSILLILISSVSLMAGRSATILATATVVEPGGLMECDKGLEMFTAGQSTELQINFGNKTINKTDFNSNLQSIEFSQKTIEMDFKSFIRRNVPIEYENIVITLIYTEN